MKWSIAQDVEEFYESEPEEEDDDAPDDYDDYDNKYDIFYM
jgi:hypothetical protein